jgi:hypothetical protein
MAIDAVLATSSAVTPKRAAFCESILKVMAGPLTTTPLNVSTTPSNFFDGCFDLLGLGLQRGGVFAEEFDFDWFGIALQIADHIGTMPTNSTSPTPAQISRSVHASL